MTLDAPKSDAELIAMLAQRTGGVVDNGKSLSVGKIRPILAPNCPVSSTPITLRIPWSALVSDNDKFVAGMKGPKPVIRITKEYAEAKARIASLARDTMAGRPPIGQPVELTARVWFPGNRGNDVTNWCKLVHDALNEIVYEDDKLIHDARWIKAGIDVDAPRAEITITLRA